MGIATGETYSFAEGKLYLYASASGSTSGSGIGWAENATIRFNYGYVNHRLLNGTYYDLLTGRRADMTIGSLYGDMTLFNLANSTAAVNAKFEGLVTGGLSQSAIWILYSGVVDVFTVNQEQDQVFKAAIGMHANTWSGFGQ